MRENIFYPQRRVFFFFWIYISEIPKGLENSTYIVDDYMCIGFHDFDSAKSFLHEVANRRSSLKAKVVYHLD